MMGIVDDDGIGIRDIQSGFNYGSGNQHIIPAFNEVQHDLFKLLSFHLSMCDNYFYIRTEAFDGGFHVSYIFDPVMDYKYLQIKIEDGVALVTIPREIILIQVIAVLFTIIRERDPARMVVRSLMWETLVFLTPKNLD